MKPARVALYLAAAGLFTACAYIPPKEGDARRSSAEYVATGSAEGIHALVYGNVTLLEIDSVPAFVVVRDGSGAAVEYERLGRYYRLGRLLDTFTVWVNGQSVTFSMPMTAHVFSAPVSPALGAQAQRGKSAVVKVTALGAPVPEPGDEDVAALLRLSATQLAEVRTLLEVAGKNPRTTHEDLFMAHERLDQMEARRRTDASTVVRVTFPPNSTAFTPSPDVAAVLIAAGKAAERVSVRGRTDARSAGSHDATIAWRRAMAARNFLVAHGVSTNKIRMYSQAAGDFAAPNATEEGKALNRRVEMEFVIPRIAALKTQSTKVATDDWQ